MRKYYQLAIEQRYQIYAFRKAGMSLKEIANELGRDKSTISRELSRNKGLRGYRPDQANKFAKARKKKARKNKKMTLYARFIIAQKIRQEWSPEQISGHFKRHSILDISHQSIYTFIKKNHKNGGVLYKHLRRATKKRRKRYGSMDARGQIKNRVMIDARPRIVDEKSRIGDWEVDTMIGSHHKGVILTLVERRSKYMVACPLNDKSETVVTNAVIGLLKPLQKRVFTITGDNGKEFAGHEKIAKNLKANFYFAHPYSSWERGLNENSNGLLRQYYPKKTDLRNVDQASFCPVLEKINNRPRKTLDYATPKEVFFGLIKDNKLQYRKVALAT